MTKARFQVARDELYRLCKAQAGEWDDPMTAWATSMCSEVTGLIARAQTARLRRFEQESGWMIDELLDEIERRTCARYVYFSVFSMASL